MLLSLDIKDLAIISKLSISFTKGFNVTTGETGAGKSIMIKALSLLAGGRSTSDLIRKGALQAEVCGYFIVSRKHPAIKLLQNLELNLEKDHKTFAIILRRNIHIKGRSQAWINDTPVSSATLRLISSSLLDIFAQHETQALLNESNHVEYIDKFVKEKSLLSEFKKFYLKCKEHHKNLKSTLELYQAKKKQEDFFQFKIAEFNKLDITKEDYEESKELCAQLSNHYELKEQLCFTQQYLEGATTKESLVDTLKKMINLLEKTNPQLKTLDDVIEKLSQSMLLINEASFELSKTIDDITFDEDEYDKLQMKISHYQNLLRKYRVSSIDELLKEFENIQKELEHLQILKNDIIHLCEQLIQDVAKMQILSKEVSHKREAKIKEIKKRVKNELTDLGMEKSELGVKSQSFDVDCSPILKEEFGDDFHTQTFYDKLLKSIQTLGSHRVCGAEKLTFLLSANQGEKMLPLSKAASGGEASRIMLALKKSLAADAGTCVLVFDEIDTGISGRIADKVAKKLSELSKTCQVLCISHLPQIAAYADNHLQVIKKQQAKRTDVFIHQLTKEEERVKEIASMLSANKITQTSLDNAKELIKRRD